MTEATDTSDTAQRGPADTSALDTGDTFLSPGWCIHENASIPRPAWAETPGISIGIPQFETGREWDRIAVSHGPARNYNVVFQGHDPVTPTHFTGVDARDPGGDSR